MTAREASDDLAASSPAARAPDAPAAVAEKSVVPRLLLGVLIGLLVLLIVGGLLLSVLHTKANVLFFVISRAHVQHGTLFVVLGVVYLVAHILRTGAGRTFVIWLALWLVSMFALFFTEIPFQACTIINVLLGGALAAGLWWRSRRKYAWQSYATAVGVMIALGGIIETGYVMAAGWTSMRTTFYHWTHLALTPAVPAMIWLHARARRRRAPSAAGYRLPRAWYAAVGVVLAGHVAWAAIRTRTLEAAPPASLLNRETPQATIHVNERAREAALEGALAPDLLQPSQTCARAMCHVGPYRQWNGSSHHFASTNIPYVRAAEAYVARNGREAEAFCAVCHNPMAVATGAYARRDWAAIEGYAREGVSCEGCHLRAAPPEKHERTTATLRALPDTPFPYAPNRGDLDYLREQYLDQDPYFHRRKYYDEYMHTSEMCGACHGERHVDVSGHEVVLFDELDGLKKSGLAEQGFSCQKCHNNLDAYARLEEGSMHARPDHVFPGIALDLPEALPRGVADGDPALAEDLRETADFLRLWLDGKHKVTEYERHYLHLIGDKRIDAFERFIEHRTVVRVSAEIRRAGDGGAVVSVTTANEKVGHDFPSGPPDLSQYWLELHVRPPGGAFRPVVGHDPATGAIDPRAPRLGGRVFDEGGADLREHAIDRAKRVELWTIPFGRSVSHEIALRADEIPAGATVRAEWRYRRYNPEFSRWAFRDEKKIFPAHLLAATEKVAP